VCNRIDMEVVMAKKFFFVCAGLLCLAAAAHAQIPAGTALIEISAGTLNALVVMDNGDVYRSDYSRNGPGMAQGPWFLACNIFTAGGPPSRVVGVGEGAVVLTAAGGWYRLAIGDPGPCYAIFDGTIGQPPEQSFVAIGVNASINGCHHYAVTDAGFVYRRWIGCGPSGWEFAGTLPVGPTPATPAAWGSVKVRYR
jgi:hypothetical protein